MAKLVWVKTSVKELPPTAAGLDPFLPVIDQRDLLIDGRPFREVLQDFRRAQRAMLISPWKRRDHSGRKPTNKLVHG